MKRYSAISERPFLRRSPDVVLLRGRARRPAAAAARAAAAILFLVLLPAGDGAARGLRPAAPGEQEQDGSEMLERLQRKYDGIRDAAISFTQRVQFGVMKSEQSFSGKLLMKKGNKYRIEMEDRTIVTDGKSVWTYTRATNQVLVDTYRDDPRSFSPDRILSNVPSNYSATVIGRDKTGTRELSILKLIPKETKSRLKWMKVWVDEDEWLMHKVQMLDAGDNLTTYSMSDIRLNAGIPDSSFRFSPPPGADLIDLR